jgi:ABC-type uncharacterized transport system ATPase subunit
MEPLLRLSNISKRYPGVQANDEANLVVYPGEIHALVGENGAGKSTLMKILYGLEQPDSGSIQWNGQEVHISNPREAIKLGIGMVHQEFMLVPSFTVAQNIVLGQEPTEGLLLHNDSIVDHVRDLSQQFRLEVDPQARTGDLPVGVQQRVEILKTLYRGVQLLILDEPTAVLTPQETAELFETMRRFAEQNRTIIFITHKLEEVMSISDRITVMRSGRVIGQRNTKEVTKEDVARMMVGRDVLFSVNKRPATPAENVLEIKGLSCKSAGRTVLNDVSLSVAAGEIVGIAGVQGNGQTELVEVLSGLRSFDAGTVLISKQPLVAGDPESIRRQRIAHIPENRETTGLCLSFSVADNAILTNTSKFTRNGFLINRDINEFAQKMVDEYDIKIPALDTSVDTLSGGNKQKLIVAREVATDPVLLLANQPTRGVDIGAIEFIHKRLVELRDKGLAVLLVSTDLEEILNLSDRVIVMYEGEIMGELDPESTSEEQLGLLMAGIKATGGNEYASDAQV